jgi:heme/copper-type cytochrome/quinol oxidase subunit 3
LRRELQFSPNLYQVGIAVALVSLSAFFIGLIFAYSSRMEASGSWQRFHVPSFLWFSTVLLAISSWVLEAARYALRRAQISRYRGRLIATFTFGLMFLALQITAGANLFHQGVTTAANPHGSAFYVFMSIHGIHLIIGLCWLGYLFLHSRRLFNGSENELRKYRAVTSVAATYWHFMGIVWGLLFFFLLRWSR